MEGAVDPADGGGAGAGLFYNVAVYLILAEQLGYLDPLCQSLQLLHRAEVFKEFIAFLHGFQFQNCAEEKFDVELLELFVHITDPPGR